MPGGLLVRFPGGLRRLRRRLEAGVAGRGDAGLLLRLVLDLVDLVVAVLAGEGGDVVGVEVDERLVGGQAAVARRGQRRVRAAAAGREDRVAAPVEAVLLLAALGLDVGVLGLGLDVDAPAGQARGKARVLALAADGQAQLVVGHDDGRLAAVVVDEDLAHARGAQRLGDEPGGLVVVGDDVDLLAAQLGDDHAHARATRADAGADRVDAVGVRDDGDLRAVARLARDVL